MLKKMIVGGVIGIAALAGTAGTSHAGVSLDLGFHLGAPAPFEPIPASPVAYAPSVNANLFSYDGQFYVFMGTGWYVGVSQNGPWSEVPPEYIPRPILAVPIRYYHVPPREWTYWRRDAAPRWAPAWGHRWEERRWEERRHGPPPPEHHAYYHDDHRGDHHIAYRDDHRDDRRWDRDRYPYDRR